MTAKSLPRSTPEAQGISSAALLAFVEALERIPEMHSLMLLRHGCVAAEGWWSPYTAGAPAHALLAQQKFHLHGGWPGGRRRPAVGR